VLLPTSSSPTTTTVMDAPVVPSTRRQRVARWSRRHRRAVGGVVSLAILVAVFIGVLPQVADLRDVVHVIMAMTWLELVTLSAATIWNLATYWFVVMASLPGATMGQAMVSTETSTAVSNTVPAGGALGMAITYRMFRSWGFDRSAVTLSMVVSGIWNNAAKLALPVLALSLMALQGAVTPSRVIAGLGGLGGLVGAIVVFALVLRRDRMAWRVGELAAVAARPLRRVLHRRPPIGWGQTVVQYRNEMLELLRHGWWRLTAWTVVGHLSLFLLLLLTMRHVGIAESEVSTIEAMAAFSFARLVTAIPFTPGGLGVVELALTAGLVAAGGDRVQVLAAVVVYRALTYVMPIGFGVLTFLYWRRQVAATPA
jgi:uncharacterized membrane protein YbhN (UPF0104 family)